MNGMFSKILKSLLLAGTSAAMLVPAASAASFSGYGELFAGAGYQTNSNQEIELCSGTQCGSYGSHDQADLSSVGGSAHGNINFDSGLGLQFDVEGQDQGYGSYSYSNTGGGVHLYKRNADYLWGGFVSIGDPGGSRVVTAGLEGQVFLDKITLYSQLSYSAGIQGYLQREGVESWNLHTEVRYFYSDNIAFSAGLGAEASDYNYSYSSGSDVYSGHNGLLQWDLRAEYLLDDLPLSLFVAYQGGYQAPHYNDNYSGGSDVYVGRNVISSNTFLLGLHFYFGQTSLIDNDRSGASLKDYNPWYGVQPAFNNNYD
jgi:hypothetical protein